MSQNGRHCTPWSLWPPLNWKSNGFFIWTRDPMSSQARQKQTSWTQNALFPPSHIWVRKSFSHQKSQFPHVKHIDSFSKTSPGKLRNFSSFQFVCLAGKQLLIGKAVDLPAPQCESSTHTQQLGTMLKRPFTRHWRVLGSGFVTIEDQKRKLNHCAKHDSHQDPVFKLQGCGEARFHTDQGRQCFLPSWLEANLEMTLWNSRSLTPTWTVDISCANKLDDNREESCLSWAHRCGVGCSAVMDMVDYGLRLLLLISTLAAEDGVAGDGTKFLGQCRRFPTGLVFRRRLFGNTKRIHDQVVRCKLFWCSI